MITMHTQVDGSTISGYLTALQHRNTSLSLDSHPVVVADLLCQSQATSITASRAHVEVLVMGYQIEQGVIDVYEGFVL